MGGVSIAERVRLHVLGVAVLVPSTLGFGISSAISLFALIGMQSHRDALYYDKRAYLLVLLMGAGVVGIISAWHLYYHFLEGDNPPAEPMRHALGLIFGCAANVGVLIILPTKSLYSDAIFLWAIVGAGSLLLILSNACRY